MALPPEQINHRVGQQSQDARRDDTADHRRGDVFHHIRAASRGSRQHDRQEAEQDGTDGHNLRADSLHCAFYNSGVQIAHRVHATDSAELIRAPLFVVVPDNADPVTVQRLPRGFILLGLVVAGWAAVIGMVLAFRAIVGL